MRVQVGWEAMLLVEPAVMTNGHIAGAKAKVLIQMGTQVSFDDAWCEAEALAEALDPQ